MTPVRLAYLVSHPIQYQAPLLRRIAADPDIALSVFFCSEISLTGYRDPGFGRRVEWDVPLLDGYDHRFLPALGDRRRLGALRPWSYGLARALGAGGFDALWVHGYARLANLAAMASARRRGLKVLLRDEATSISAPRGAVRRAAKTVFFSGLRPLCDAVLAIGSLNRRYFEANGFAPERIFSMPYAVDNLYFRARAEAAAPEREGLRAALGLAPGRPVILYASKLARRKRPDDLLEAYAALAAHGPRPLPYLLFVGDGEMARELRDRASTRGLADVRFLGFRNQSELPALYELCDVFVLPSVFEPWAMVVNEAMNAGRAVIISDQVGAGADLVEHGGNGMVFPAGDRAALTAALAQVLSDPDRCRAMGRQSRERIARWGFDEDVAGLKAALAAVLRR